MTRLHEPENGWRTRRVVLARCSALPLQDADLPRDPFHDNSPRAQHRARLGLAHSAVPGALQRTRFDYDEATGEIASLVHVPAGYGKVTTLTRVQSKLGIPDGRVVYTGDGTSDIHVLLHVNQRDGFTVAVSEARDIAQIAKRTVISDDALSVLIPILEDLCGWDVAAIRAFFEAQNVVIHEWGKVQTDWLTLRPVSPDADLPPVAVVG